MNRSTSCLSCTGSPERIQPLASSPMMANPAPGTPLLTASISASAASSGEAKTLGPAAFAAGMASARHSPRASALSKDAMSVMRFSGIARFTIDQFPRLICGARRDCGSSDRDYCFAGSVCPCRCSGRTRCFSSGSSVAFAVWRAVAFLSVSCALRVAASWPLASAWRLASSDQGVCGPCGPGTALGLSCSAAVWRSAAWSFVPCMEQHGGVSDYVSIPGIQRASG